MAESLNVSFTSCFELAHILRRCQFSGITQREMYDLSHAFHFSFSNLKVFCFENSANIVKTFNSPELSVSRFQYLVRWNCAERTEGRAAAIFWSDGEKSCTKKGHGSERTPFAAPVPGRSSIIAVFGRLQLDWNVFRMVSSIYVTFSATHHSSLREEISIRAV